MSDRSAIEWTDASWNPIRASVATPNGIKIGWHCEHASEGCRNCYAEAFNRRLGTGFDYKPGHLVRPGPHHGDLPRGDVSVFLDETMLLRPLKWKKPRKIFVCSMTDLFGRFVTDEMIVRMFAVMALCPQHQFQVLTKRGERMRTWANDPETAARVWHAVDDLIDRWDEGAIKCRLRAFDGDPQTTRVSRAWCCLGRRTPVATPQSLVRRKR
jgi:protein gp37